MKSSKHRIISIALSALIAISCILTLAPLNTIAANQSSENRLHYWSFDGNCIDASNAIEFSYKSEPKYAEGKHSEALDTKNGPALQSDTLKDNTLRGFTMGAWFTLDSDARDWNIIMSKGDTLNSGADRFQIHIGHASEAEGGGYILTYVPAAGGLLSNKDDGVFVPFNTWTNVAVTYNGEYIRMYINGELAAERKAEGSLELSKNTYNTITVGALNHDGQTFRFCGSIDDAFYANYPLTAQDVKAAYEDQNALKAWSDGSSPIVPDEMEEIEQPTPAPTPEPISGTGNMIFYWSFDGNTRDLSHARIDQDVDGNADGYSSGKAGKSVYLSFPIISDTLPENIDLTEFTIALWVKWEENSFGSYTVPIAIAGKETNHHFEIYYTVDGDEGELAFYNTGTGINVEHIATVERDVYNHIVAVNGGGKFIMYLNGEKVYESNRMIVTKGLGTAEDVISLGSLTDTTLTCSGEYDEVLIADHVLSDELIAKLYSDPEGAQADVIALVEANYPEGYTAPTNEPEKTSAPTDPPVDNTPVDEITPAPTEDSSEENTPVPGKTPQNDSNKDNTGKDTGKGPNVGIIIAVIAGVVIVAAAVAAALLLKKKKK